MFGSARACLDTGASGHYVAVSDARHLDGVTPLRQPLHVTLPDGSRLTAWHEGFLRLEGVPREVRHCHVFAGLRGSLVSVGRLCDAGMSATFTASTVEVTYKGCVVLTGSRSPGGPTWLYALEGPRVAPDVVESFERSEVCALAVPATGTRELVAYYHAAMGSPAVSTLTEAVRRGWVQLPGLTVEALRRWPPRSTATAKGHLDRNKSGQRSTREADDQFPTARSAPRAPKGRRVDVFTHVHADLTGQFPVRSVSGNEYVLLAYVEDYNYVVPFPVRDRAAGTLAAAFRQFLVWCADKGLQPNVLHLDNEVSAEVRDVLRGQGVSLQLCPPGSHRANTAERCIRTFKNHCVATLAAADPNFPLELWDQLLPQLELTVNLLRGSRSNPDVSAWNQVHGPFDFNAHPFAPPGTKVVAYSDAESRQSWAPHGVDAFYLGPALGHYRSYEVWVPQTRAKRVTDTVAWFPSEVAMPGPSPLLDLECAVRDLEAAVCACSAEPGLAAHPGPLRQLRSLSAALSGVRESFRQAAGPDPRAAGPDPRSPRPENGAEGESPEQSERAPRQGVDAGPSDPKGASPTAGAAPAPVSGRGSGGPPPARGKGRPSHACPGCRQFVGTGVQCDGCSAWWHFGCDKAVTPQVRLRLRRQPYFCSNCRGKDASLPVAGAPTRRVDTFRAYSAPVPARRRRLERRGRGRKRRKRKRPARTPSSPGLGTGSDTPPTSDSDSDVEQAHLACTAVDLGQDGSVLTYKKAMSGPDRDEWEEAHAVEWDRLVKLRECVQFVPRNEKPPAKGTCYFNPVLKVKRTPTGTVKRVRGTAGGDRVCYNGDVSAETASLETVKLLWNAVCSERARWMCLDITDFYLGTPMRDPEYMVVPLELFPRRTRGGYGLDALAENGKVLVKVVKAIYGLPQAGKLARDRLVEHLRPYGYRSTAVAPSLFRHDERDLAFTLVVDDFGVKYRSQADVHHLVHALEQLYEVKQDWTGSKYVGIVTKHDPVASTLTLSMPGYVEKALRRFGVEKPTRPVHSARVYDPPEFGRRGPQAPPKEDLAEPLSAQQVSFVQQVVGVLLFYARAVDATLVYPVSKVATGLARPTQTLLSEVRRLLDYVATYPDASVTVHPSGMVLRGESDASWAAETGSRSRLAGVWFLGSSSDDTPFNAPVECTSVASKTVALSAAEAEYVALFHNAQKGARLKLTLGELGYPQGAVPVKTDSECAWGLATGTRQGRRTKAVLLRYDWLKEQTATKQLRVFWRRGVENRADYLSKALPVHQVQALRSQWVGSDQAGQSVYTDRCRRPTRPVPRLGTSGRCPEPSHDVCCGDEGR